MHLVIISKDFKVALFHKHLCTLKLKKTEEGTKHSKYFEFCSKKVFFKIMRNKENVGISNTKN